jgi:hypothetical protein
MLATLRAAEADGSHIAIDARRAGAIKLTMAVLSFNPHESDDEHGQRLQLVCVGAFKRYPPTGR